MNYSLSLSLGRARVSGLDPDTAAYIALSGATDTAGIDAIARYMRAEGLRDNYRLVPLKSAQNAGTGTTAYGLGGLTADHMSLVNGPTWGASAMTFVAASSQYGSIPDFLDTETITQFFRANITAGTGDRVIVGQRQSIPDARSVWFAASSGGGLDDRNSMSRTSSGNILSGLEVFINNDNLSGTQRTFVSQWISGGAAGLWWDKTSKTLSLAAGTAQTQHANVSSLVTIMAGIAAGSPVFPTSGAVAAAMWLRGSLTTTQRETITDLINAL